MEPHAITDLQVKGILVLTDFSGRRSPRCNSRVLPAARACLSQRLRELFRVGRTSLLIGLIALAAAIALGDFLASLMKGSRIGEILRETLTIGGWVSMWRPLEVFLYDWWPIRNEARLSNRLAAMPVRIRYINAAPPER